LKTTETEEARSRHNQKRTYRYTYSTLSEAPLLIAGPISREIVLRSTVESDKKVAQPRQLASGTSAPKKAMEQDTTGNQGQAGGTARTPADVLRAGLTPELFGAMQTIFHGFEQQFIAVDQHISLTQGIEHAIQTGFANTKLSVNINQPAQPPPAPPSLLTPLRMTLQPFSGKANENVQSWLGMIEDVLTASRVPRENWTYLAAQVLREPALTWYFARKRANQNRVLHWDELKPAMQHQWDNPSRVNELRMRLDGLITTGLKGRSISEYTRLFQDLEVQISKDDMTAGDRKYKYLKPLPEELHMRLMGWKTTSMNTIPRPASGKDYTKLRPRKRALSILELTNSLRKTGPY
jgi:hypothetical protein